eukprot:CAMPEP_0196579350 /NCGR_PEP_ID=MMETSP1081-20130531/20555_1 /TAXON_ID=36882 /ORGANISM="Pyramimonas amylifera, Strain CCMP720" /LENGTH=62 /DNA_ID=CAMNT_0041898901 /DNA_START=258 /DNA_END=446 /DNA_ORIENTATION=-
MDVSAENNSLPEETSAETEGPSSPSSHAPRKTFTRQDKRQRKVVKKRDEDADEDGQGDEEWE